MSEKKPLPLVTMPKRDVCPVCGHASYSSTGIHPQCALSQADAKRRAKLIAAKKQLASEEQTEQIAPEKNVSR
jgi:hypothetical protein